MREKEIKSSKGQRGKERLWKVEEEIHIKERNREGGGRGGDFTVL